MDGAFGRLGSTTTDSQIAHFQLYEESVALKLNQLQRMVCANPLEQDRFMQGPGDEVVSSSLVVIELNLNTGKRVEGAGITRWRKASPERGEPI